MRLKSNLLPILVGIVGLVTLTPAATLEAARANDAAVQKNAPSSTKLATTKLTQAQQQAKHGAEGVMQIEIAAPQSVVWDTLTDFGKYPHVFKRLQSCRVVKREGSLVFTETFLRPHIFVNEPCEHEVNDLSAAPNVLTWRSVDGNFKEMDGKWELKPVAGGDKCLAVYTLAVDASGCIPGPLLGFCLKSMQKEIVTSLKKSAETNFADFRTRTSKANSPAIRGNG